MNTTEARIWINQNYDLIKHWLFVIIGFTLITFALLSYANSNRLLKQVTTLTEQNKVLSQENKQLNQATQKTGDVTQGVVLQNRQYIECLSKIFANYTHNFVPITIEDLNTCTIRTDGISGSTSVNNANSSASQTGSSMPSSTSSASGQGTSQGSSSTSGSSSNPTPPPQQPQPNLLHRILNDLNPFK